MSASVIIDGNLTNFAFVFYEFNKSMAWRGYKIRWVYLAVAALVGLHVL